MTIYISAVMFIMFWFNEDFWGFTYGMEDDMFSKGEPTLKCFAFTMLFNIFIWMHIFNLLNCREISEKRFNPFIGISKNWLFFGMLGAIIALQFIMVEYGGVLARTSGLTDKQHSYSILIGSTVLIPSYLIKRLPERITRILQIDFKDHLIKGVDDNKLVRGFNKLANSKATDLMDKTTKKNNDASRN
jgi:magnesium-transporting ATPase (P-type)